MSKEEFIKQLAQILVAHPNDLTPQTPLKDFKSWDSMAKMTVLTIVDTDMGVPVPLDSLQHWETVGDILALVETHLKP